MKDFFGVQRGWNFMCDLGLRLEKSMFFNEKKLEKTLFIEKNGLEFLKCFRGHHAYSHDHRLNRICSETNSFDKRCNYVEIFLLERGYSFKLMQKKILRVRTTPRNELLEKEKSLGQDSKLTLNVTYYSVFRHLKSQLKNYM